MSACFIVIIYIIVWFICAKYGLVSEWVLWAAAIGLIIVLAVGVSK